LSAHIIAITGASGSGKSHLTDHLCESLRGQVNLAVIREDSYYRDQSHLPFAQRHGVNYDHPESLEHELLAYHLRQLKAGNPVEVPEYDYSQHNRRAVTTTVQGHSLILLEGILLLSNPILRELFDLALFVDTPLDVCFNRRLARDVRDRGRTEESVRSQFESTVKPMFFEFIEPNKEYAQIMISGDSDIQIMLAEIQQLVLPLARPYTLSSDHS
jgi:uridine kinase